MIKSRILIAGGSGFIGQGLCADARFSDAVNIGRKRMKNQYVFVSKTFKVGEPLDDILPNIDTIIYAAGIAHTGQTANHSKRKELNQINREYPVYLANQASKYGVKRFVFVSSLKVLGDVTENGYKYKADDPYCPVGDYAASKVSAEKELLELAYNSELELIILRVPLVIGPGAKGNLKSISRVAKFGVPLPFSGILNKRSVISIDNLVDAIFHCATDKRAANKIVMLKDKYDMSTPEILRETAKLQGANLKLFWVPIFILRALFILIGRRDLINKLLQSCQVDDSDTQRVIGWVAK